MSEHKTTEQEVIDTEFQIEHVKDKIIKLKEVIIDYERTLDKLEQRHKSLLNYLNTDSDSINQDKTE